MTSIILVKWVFHWLRSVSFCRKITFDFFLMDAWLGNGRRVEVYETVEVERYKRKVMSCNTLMIHNWVRNMRLLFATIIWFQCAWCMEIACDYNPTQEAWHDFGAEPFCLHVGSCWTCHEIPWRPMMIGSFQEINLKHQGDRSDLSPWRTTLPRNLRHVSWQHERLVEGSWRQSIGPPRTWSKHKKGEWKSQCVELFSGEVFFPGKVEAYMSWIYEECTPCPPFSSRCPVSDGGSCSGTCDMPLCLCLPRSHLTPFCEQVCPSF